MELNSVSYPPSGREASYAVLDRRWVWNHSGEKADTNVDALLWSTFIACNVLFL